MIGRVLCLALLAIFPGCFYVRATGSFGPELNEEALARIVPGETTKAQVLQWLGPPEEYLRSEVLDSLLDEDTRLAGAVAVGNRAHDAFTYQRDELDSWGTWPVLYAYVDSEVTSDLLVIFFDAEDRVEALSFRSAAETP